MERRDGTPALNHKFPNGFLAEAAVPQAGVGTVLRLSTAGPMARQRWRWRRLEPRFRIWNLNNAVLGNTRQQNAAGGRLDGLHHVEEVGQQTFHIELDGAVHVKDILGGEVAGVVGQGRLLAEALEQLDVSEAIRQARRVAQRDFGPGDLVRAVEREEGGEAHPVGEVGEVLEFAELGQAAAAPVAGLRFLIF
jgi:hypothetical protein